MPRGPRDPAVTLPPPRGGEDGKARTEERALATHPADEIDVFHDGDVGKASRRLEPRPADEQGLVAVGETEQRDAQANAELDDTSEHRRRIKREALASRDI